MVWAGGDLGLFLAFLVSRDDIKQVPHPSSLGPPWSSGLGTLPSPSAMTQVKGGEALPKPTCLPMGQRLEWRKGFSWLGGGLS